MNTSTELVRLAAPTIYRFWRDGEGTAGDIVIMVSAGDQNKFQLMREAELPDLPFASGIPKLAERCHRVIQAAGTSSIPVFAVRVNGPTSFDSTATIIDIARLRAVLGE